MSDQAKNALEKAEAAIEMTSHATVVVAGIRALMPFAIAGRQPTSEELAEIMSTMLPPEAEMAMPDIAEQVREWVRGVLRDAREIKRRDG